MESLTLDKVYHAAYVLKSVARKTDLIHAAGLCPGCDLYLKTENLQVTGSFKVRGAYYKISQLTEEEKSKGVIASSAGNHAQGVALAAKENGIPCVICMPDGAPISKVEATKAYGAKVCLVKGAYDDAYDYACELQEKEGYTFIHPFNDPEVIAGQGTIGLEILDQLSDVEVVLVPVGGGGLISGVAYAIKKLHPECKVYGVQAAGSASMEQSLKQHEPITLDTAATFADGIAVKDVYKRQQHELLIRGHRNGSSRKRHHPGCVFRQNPAGQARRHEGDGAGGEGLKAQGYPDAGGF